MADVPAPAVPIERLGDGWALAADEVETLFELPTLRVHGRTLRYEDERLRERTREAVGAPLTQFLFATRVAFEPPLNAGSAAMVRPTVVDEALDAFAEELRDRGVESVERGRRERIRTDGGDRATLATYRGVHEVGDATLPVEGWVAVWRAEGFRVAGAGRPRSLAEFGIEGETDREDLLGVLRAVG